MASPRIQPQNEHAIPKEKYVLLLMRNARARFLPSFSFASQRANSLNVPVLAAYIYTPVRHNLAQRIFLLEGLQELKKSFADYGTPFVALKAEDFSEGAKTAAKLSDSACEVIIDAAYLRQDLEYDEQVKKLLDEKKRKLTKVVSSVVVPVLLADSGSTVGARVLRNKIWKHVGQMLSEKWDDLPEVKCDDWKKIVDASLTEMNLPVELKEAQEACKTCKHGLVGGENEAQQVLKKFLSEKLNTYNKLRNDVGSQNQSFLSPYLHFGMISTVDVICQVRGTKAPKQAKDAFLDQIVTQRELAFNFVFYNKDTYDKFDCLPKWVRRTMEKHHKDERQVVYSAEDLEAGRTHDPYWNASQFELVYTHKIQNYMRLYWAKKVIEFTPDYESAHAFLIEQNDKYALDGRDPIGYTGIIWSFGVKDRPFFERPVYGRLRYMNEEGLRRKFKDSIDDYVQANYNLAGRKLLKENEEPVEKARRTLTEKETSEEEPPTKAPEPVEKTRRTLTEKDTSEEGPPPKIPEPVEKTQRNRTGKDTSKEGPPPKIPKL